MRYRPCAVGDRGANLVDQRRAGRFDRHARQDRARRVAHDPGDAAAGILRESVARQAHQGEGDNRRCDSETLHNRWLLYD